MTKEELDLLEQEMENKRCELEEELDCEVLWQWKYITSIYFMDYDLHEDDNLNWGKLINNLIDKQIKRFFYVNTETWEVKTFDEFKEFITKEK